MPSKKTKKTDSNSNLHITVDGKESLPWVAPASQVQVHKTQVTVIRLTGDSTVVQYVQDGVLSRRIVPAEQVIGNHVADHVLAAGIPYGYSWEDIQLTFDMRKFVNELHQVDIWTAEDLLKSPQKLWSALRAALADNLSNVLEIARNEHKGANRK